MGGPADREARSAGDLPVGTVTFLFADVAGSTRLLEELGPERYGEVLLRQRDLIEQAASRHAGMLVDTQGDGSFLAFPAADRALAAAAAAQDALAGGPAAVRMGIHTGTPHVVDGAYVGLDVHLAARIAASAHGGQVLVSSSTADLVGGAGLRYLGEHRFKDLARPERIFQLGETAFPPIRSIGHGNLPVPATPFLGRKEELHAVVGLLSDEHTRIVTIVGTGGTGKTRLALQAAAEVADRYPDGTWWVRLAPLEDVSRLPAAIADAMGTTLPAGRDPAEALAEAVRAKRSLLVLDNLEHLLPNAAIVVGAVRDAGGPRILVTSRERLRIAGERVFDCPPMASSDAVALFAARAADAGAVIERDDVVGHICDRLDALPLAIELAAARTTLFTPRQLLERLAGRLDLLKGTRDADPRQATLRATIDWSYHLLSEDEQRVLRGLGVFAGGCRLEAAEAVAGAEPDDLQSLLDKSLLRRRHDPDGEARYWLLETIREYARERLVDAGDAAELEARHARWYAAFGQQVGDAQGADDEEALIARVRVETDDLLAALERAERVPDASVAYRVLRAHAALSMMGADGALIVGFTRLLEHEDLTAMQRAQALQGLAVSLNGVGRHDEAVAALEQSISLGRGGPPSRQRMRALVVLVSTLTDLGRLDEALAHLDEADGLVAEGLAAGLDLDLETMYGAAMRSSIALQTGDWDGAIATGVACLAMPGASSGYARGHVLHSIAFAAAMKGDARHALEAADESLALNARIGYAEGVVLALVAAAGAQVATAPSRAAALIAQAEAVRAGAPFELGSFEAAFWARTVARITEAGASSEGGADPTGDLEEAALVGHRIIEEGQGSSLG